MKILTVDNETYELDEIPETIEDLRYGVLDYTNPKNVDYYFIPLIFLESFYSPAAVLQIGKYTVNVPLDWSIIICDPEVGDPEVVSLMSLNDRGFTTFVMNPINGFQPQYLQVDIVNVYNDIKWHAPKLKYGHLLCVPLSDEPESPCIIIVKDANKIPEVLDMNEIW
ncbi:hypothetical protein N8072_00930 [bacterium]|jgi:hypothetical protein|nr:hypothetical protein [bacterium]MDB4128741.1 hypothetical protein [bacterium]MDC1257224.1 hypothetical protein [bacterium]